MLPRRARRSAACRGPQERRLVLRCMGSAPRPRGASAGHAASPRAAPSGPAARGVAADRVRPAAPVPRVGDRLGRHHDPDDGRRARGVVRAALRPRRSSRRVPLHRPRLHRRPRAMEPVRARALRGERGRGAGRVARRRAGSRATHLRGHRHHVHLRRPDRRGARTTARHGAGRALRRPVGAGPRVVGRPGHVGGLVPQRRRRGGGRGGPVHAPGRGGDRRAGGSRSTPRIPTRRGSARPTIRARSCCTSGGT